MTIHRTPDGEISLGDLVEALVHLEVGDHATARAIASLLGLAEKTRADVNLTREDGPGKREPEEPAAMPTTFSPTPRDAPRPRSETFLRSTLEHIAGEEPPQWDVTLTTLPPATDERSEPPPPHEPLFVPRWSRAIVSLALATPRRVGTVNVHAIIDRLARAEPVREWPRQLVRTMAGGVQLLIDRSSGMVPFARDADLLAQNVVRVAGSELTRVLRFKGSPLRKVLDPRTRQWMAYEPPPRGTAIALITDFGIARDELALDRAGAGEWIEWLRALRDHGHHVTAFVPYPAARWPAGIATLATLVEWDRRTDIGRVRAAVRR